MHAYLMKFLQEMERRFPPMPNCHHIICVAEYGSAELGFVPKLCLHMATTNRQTFFLDEDDFGVVVHAHDFQAAIVALADTVTGMMVEQGIFPTKEETGG